jgi:hypothetical protein
MYLKEFFAVTGSGSLYQVTSTGNPKEHPSVVKIATKGKSNVALNTRLESSPRLSVGKQLIFFNPPRNEKHLWRPLRSGEVRLNYYGSQTSSVVALFLDEEDARNCFVQSELEPCDSRWHSQTRVTLQAIGDNHPHFSIPENPEIALILQEIPVSKT